jgi:phosphate butyryltransferase
MVKKLEEIVKLAETRGRKKVAVAQAADHEVLAALAMAVEHKLIDPILVGNEKEIEDLIKKEKLALGKYEIVNVPEPAKAAEEAVKIVSSGRANMIMKGLVDTSLYLGAILNKEWGLRTKSLLSHVALFEAPRYEKLMGLTDVAMNIAPDLKAMTCIVQNAVDVMHALGFERPKVAMLAAVEVVNPDMPATIVAAALRQMGARGQIKNAEIDGPLALDNAIDVEAAKIKKITSAVAGQADILVAPDIEAGNVLYKALSFFMKCHMAAIIVGAKAPVVLTSRADSHESKFFSISLAAAVAGK